LPGRYCLPNHLIQTKSSGVLLSF